MKPALYKDFMLIKMCPHFVSSVQCSLSPHSPQCTVLPSITKYSAALCVQI